MRNEGRISSGAARRCRPCHYLDPTEVAIPSSEYPFEGNNRDNFRSTWPNTFCPSAGMFRSHALSASALLSGVLCMMFSCEAQIFASTDSTVDSFKSFMQSRPVITKVVFDWQALAGPPPGLSLPPSAVQAATNVQHFQAAWQPDAFFLRRLWNVDDVDTVISATSSTAGLIFAGKSGDKLWHIVNTNIYFSTQETNDDFVVHTCKNAMQLLRAAINVGAEHMVARSLNWEGDKFTARTDSGTKMHGSLKVRNGLPDRLVVEYEDANQSYVSDFIYADSQAERLPHGLPNVVYTTLLEKGRSIPQSRTVFFVLECTNSDLDPSYFDSDRWIDAEKGEIIATNKALYWIQNGFVGPKLRDLNDASQKTWKRFCIIVILGVTFAAPMVFLFITNRKKEKENERK